MLTIIIITVALFSLICGVRMGVWSERRRNMQFIDDSIKQVDVFVKSNILLNNINAELIKANEGLIAELKKWSNENGSKR